MTEYVDRLEAVLRHIHKETEYPSNISIDEATDRLLNIRDLVNEVAQNRAP